MNYCKVVLSPYLTHNSDFRVQTGDICQRLAGKHDSPPLQPVGPNMSSCLDNMHEIQIYEIVVFIPQSLTIATAQK